jgi:nitrite reductase/ring-hydroxylating ferredoxin subunit
MSALRDAIDRIEGMQALDAVVNTLGPNVRRAVHPDQVRNLLSGTYLGHPVHPPATDVTIGAWTMATLLDLLGGRRNRRTADFLTGIGVVFAVPTAASGLNDWSDTTGRVARVGVVHAGANTTALTLYLGSLVARSKGHGLTAKAFRLGGLAALLAGGYLGGHLAYSRGVNVNRNAWQRGPAEWTAVLPDHELVEGAHRTVSAGAVPVVVYRENGEVRAFSATCSHLGGPLGEGKLADGCVTCPWHGSMFRVADGSVVRGPASSWLPTYEARVHDAVIEVRAVG